MKVVAISHSAVEKHHCDYFNELAKINGIELHVFRPSYWPLKTGGVGLIKLLFGKYKKIYADEVDSKGYELITKEMVFSGKSYNFYPSLFSYLSKIKPDIIHVMEEPWTLNLLLIAIWRNIFSPNTKLVFTTWENLYRPYRKRLLYNLINYKIIENLNFKNYEGAFVSYDEVIDVLRKKGYKGKTKIAIWGVDPKVYKKMDSKSLRKKLGLSKFVVGFSGRFEKSKGIFTLLEAVSKLKDYQLMFMGWSDNNLQKEIMNYAKENNFGDEIVFTGRILGDDIPKYLNCMDVLALPSLTTKFWKEQFGKVIIEANSCSVPVIGSSSGSIPFVVGKGGLIFKEGNSNELRKCLERIMKDKKLRNKLSLEGKKQVMDNYTWKKIAEKTYGFYKEILSSN